MALKLTNDEHYAAIADAIRTKAGTPTAKYKPADMANAIRAIEINTGVQDKGRYSQITQNATYTDLLGYSSVVVNVPASNVTNGGITITNNSNGIDVTDKKYVNVNVSADTLANGTLDITSNGNNINVVGKRYVNVNVESTKIDTSGVIYINSFGHIKVTDLNSLIHPDEVEDGVVRITSNNVYDVSGKTMAIVEIPAYANEVGSFSVTSDGDIIMDTMSNLINVSNTNLINNGVLRVTSVGRYDLTNSDEEIKLVNVDMSANSFVSGTKDITGNGNGIDVASYSKVNVNVATANAVKGTITITGNSNNIDVSKYALANVAVSADTLAYGNKVITENNVTTNVVGLRTVTVNVDPGSIVSGTKEIIDNGNNIDVSSFKYVNVNVPVNSGTATGTKLITTNGTHDVAGLANVQVNVSPSDAINPNMEYTATANTSENEYIDITNYAKLKVNVPIAGSLTNVREETISNGYDNTYTLEYDVANYKTFKLTVNAYQIHKQWVNNNGSSITLTENGTDYDVSDAKTVNIDVDISSSDEPAVFGLAIRSDGTMGMSSTGSAKIIWNT